MSDSDTGATRPIFGPGDNYVLVPTFESLYKFMVHIWVYEETFWLAGALTWFIGPHTPGAIIDSRFRGFTPLTPPFIRPELWEVALFDMVAMDFCFNWLRLLRLCCLWRFPSFFWQIFDNCYEGGAVSPSTCIYMKEWMDYWVKTVNHPHQGWWRCESNKSDDETTSGVVSLRRSWSS